MDNTLNRYNDRCDRCGAQAFVVTAHGPGLALSWCGHHFAIHEEAIQAAGGGVVADERDSINHVPSMSASV